uniref:Uncharacterized protein n=1 Tax=Chromera velia CCMP2878 TaxID=1169474 RepID=A0A0G4IE24_9ALVE|eukprot:Cvel_2362.t1-p1 / transcript=Cvel_2362.t1 / gene=Cvel_2362 / organism=Chromera_velia_CCMP2878 / gene_product=hypothetical protein / transcript_product=hypothetical protein / location=Cvel_scaffold91:116919-119846(+) / protein_length=813 / sequence_SO=supercontig / SO=protein_coding / is_pseudo=false
MTVGVLLQIFCGGFLALLPLLCVFLNSPSKAPVSVSHHLNFNFARKILLNLVTDFDRSLGEEKEEEEAQDVDQEDVPIDTYFDILGVKTFPTDHTVPGNIRFPRVTLGGITGVTYDPLSDRFFAIGGSSSQQIYAFELVLETQYQKSSYVQKLTEEGEKPFGADLEGLIDIQFLSSYDLDAPLLSSLSFDPQGLTLLPGPLHSSDLMDLSRLESEDQKSDESLEEESESKAPTTPDDSSPPVHALISANPKYVLQESPEDATVEPGRLVLVQLWPDGRTRYRGDIHLPLMFQSTGTSGPPFGRGFRGLSCSRLKDTCFLLHEQPLLQDHINTGLGPPLPQPVSHENVSGTQFLEAPIKPSLYHPGTVLIWPHLHSVRMLRLRVKATGTEWLERSASDYFDRQAQMLHIGAAPSNQTDPPASSPSPFPSNASSLSSAVSSSGMSDSGGREPGKAADEGGARPRELWSLPIPDAFRNWFAVSSSSSVGQGEGEEGAGKASRKEQNGGERDKGSSGRWATRDGVDVIRRLVPKFSFTFDSMFRYNVDCPMRPEPWAHYKHKMDDKFEEIRQGHTAQPAYKSLWQAHKWEEKQRRERSERKKVEARESTETAKGSEQAKAGGRGHVGERKLKMQRGETGEQLESYTDGEKVGDSEAQRGRGGNVRRGKGHRYLREETGREISSITPDVPSQNTSSSSNSNNTEFIKEAAHGKPEIFGGVSEILALPPPLHDVVLVLERARGYGAHQVDRGVMNIWAVNMSETRRTTANAELTDCPSIAEWCIRRDWMPKFRILSGRGTLRNEMGIEVSQSGKKEDAR